MQNELFLAGAPRHALFINIVLLPEINDFRLDGSTGYLSGLANPADREINVELTYYAQLTDEITLQPDIQWIVNPGIDDDIADALVFGLRLSVGKTWEIN